jgi:hypothetical protein
LSNPYRCSCLFLTGLHVFQPGIHIGFKRFKIGVRLGFR